MGGKARRLGFVLPTPTIEATKPRGNKRKAQRVLGAPRHAHVHVRDRAAGSTPHSPPGRGGLQITKGAKGAGPGRQANPGGAQFLLTYRALSSGASRGCNRARTLPAPPPHSSSQSTAVGCAQQTGAPGAGSAFQQPPWAQSTPSLHGLPSPAPPPLLLLLAGVLLL